MDPSQVQTLPTCYISSVELRIGSTVGPYCVEGLVAEGGMSLVYRVRHQEQDSLHALKVLTIHTRAVRARLEQEGQLQRLLRHPNIVPVTDVIRVAHSPALVMEYVAGPDLSELLDRCRLTDSQVDFLARGMLRGMIAAHANGMVHRDLKPSNILIEISDSVLTPRITDFGLAKLWSADDSRLLTQAGAVMGTPGYMAPEQVWDASTVDERADVFSLGTMLYEALSGLSAFTGGHNVEIWSRITAGKYVPLQKLRPDLPSGVIHTIRRAMAADRDQRTPDMKTLLTEWERALTGASSVEVDASQRWPGPTLNAAQRLLAERDERITHDGRLPMESQYDIVTTIYPYLLCADLEDERTDTGASDLLQGRQWAGPTAASPSNLPVQVDRFIGRSAELAALNECLKSDTPILTLSGPGGMGKTRLSLAFGEENQSKFPGGVWFCDLTEARTQQDILRTVAQALGVPLSEKKPALQLAHAIDGRGETLIILDNMEQVVAHAASTVGKWTRHAPAARFLVTSRIQLGLQGEHRFVLGPLDTQDGIELFEERARSRRPDFALSPEDRQVVGQIVDSLDGMSLGIELAAARIEMLNPSQILERLAQRFQLLSYGRQDQTARQSTLKGAIDWSWDLLKPVERAALAQCSIFRGGFTLECAEDILDLEPWGEWLMDVVQRLVQQSLIRSTEPIPGQIRFQLYESIREYAEEKMNTPGAVVGPDGQDLSGPPAIVALGRRHCTFFAGMGEAQVLDDRFWGGSVDDRQAFRIETDNLATAIALGRNSPNPGIQVRAAVAWAAIHRWYGPYKPALSVILDVMERKDLDPRCRLQLVETAAELYRSLGQEAGAVAGAEECIEIARMLKDVGAEGRALYRHTYYLSNVLTDDEAETFYETALVMLRAAGEWRTEVDTLLALGRIYMHRSQLDKGRRVGDEIVRMCREKGSLWQETQGLRFRATYFMDIGQMDLAEQALTEALAHAQRLEKKTTLTGVLGALGTFYKDLGRLEESVKAHERGIRICQEIGGRSKECILTGNLALIRQLEGKPDEARVLYEYTVRLAEVTGLSIVAKIAVGNLGDLLLSQGQLEESRSCLEEAIEGLDALGHNSSGAFRGSLAWVCAQMSDCDAARTLLEQGEEQLRGVWMVELGRLLCRRARVEHLAGCNEHAQSALGEAQQIAEQLGGGPDSDLGQLITETQGVLDG
jgi:predicted ATPase/serine/threonine protein kinase/tetratricopeptide (TPR) repeat protein